ncbi:PAS domain-containing protein [Corticibacter populi]|uniref:histidine kinase n=2 Tax=Corticibacter populi TaxID=1550736 RepID=A0A3M6R1V8_9BURK|nr:PAS domain-containing protein [Corticibacter populi]
MRFFHWSKQESAEPRRFIGIWANLQYFWRKQQRRHQYQEEKLRRYLDEIRMALQASPNGVVLLDHEWKIEWLNGMAAEHLGLDEQRDMGKVLLLLVRDPDFTSYCTVGDFSQSLEMDSRILDVSKALGRLRLAVQIFGYGDGKRLLLSRDITHVQKADAMRRDFIANVSHEIRTPLTIFSGLVETLQTLPLAPAEQQRYYGMMDKQARRMQVLVEDLLTLSRLEGSPLPSLSEFVDVKNLLLRCRDEAYELSAALAPGRNVAVHAIHVRYGDEQGQWQELAAPSGRKQDENAAESATGGESASALQPLPVSAWPASMGRLAAFDKEIHSAFSNLVANAVRYTPAGGVITLLWQWHADGSASFAVQDSGPGIAAEHLPRLTERFYRVDRSRSRETGGTGLGLAIVKHVTQRHGGRLVIESVLGKGSTFRIELPAARLQTVVMLQAKEAERQRRERMLAA